MPRRIEHRTEYGHPAEVVYAALTDETYLRERLAAIGGRSFELVSYAGDRTAMKAVTRQSIDPEYLPGVVRRIAPDGVLIERTESWDGGGDGRYQGTVQAAVSGFTGSLQGATALVDAAGGAQLHLDGAVKVGIPLIGGKVEDVIVEQLGRLLRLEARFTVRWLQSRQG